MNSKEVFEKIETAITKALNKEEGIILGGKELEFEQHKYKMDKWTDVCEKSKKANCVKVHILQDSEFSDMWHISVFKVLYKHTAVEYAIEELKKTLGKSPLVSENNWYNEEDSFGIAITFAYGSIKDS